MVTISKQINQKNFNSFLVSIVISIIIIFNIFKMKNFININKTKNALSWRKHFL